MGDDYIMRVIVDEDTCTCCGLCAETCPEVFEVHEKGVAVVLVEEVPPELESLAREAAEGCPVEAIAIEEE